MRRTLSFSVSIVLAAVALALPPQADARPWHNLTPGASTKSDVIKKFGSPTRELPMTPRYASGLVFQGKAASDYGAEEAQFFFNDKMKLIEIFVFPQVTLKRDDVIKAWGTGFDERRTDDFRLYFQYKQDGFVVFFDKDNETVYQLQYTPSAVAAPEGGPQASAEKPPPRAP